LRLHRSEIAARRALYVILPLIFAASAGDSGESSRRVLRITVLRVWASGRGAEGSVEKKLESCLAPMKRTTGKGSLRLEDGPVNEILAPLKRLVVELPEGYVSSWALERDTEGKTVLRQAITNPSGVLSVDLLKRSPAFTYLDRIGGGEETFVLVVRFEEGLEP
jgi:hypothetical protein